MHPSSFGPALTLAFVLPSLPAQSPNLLPSTGLPDAVGVGIAAGTQRLAAGAAGTNATLVVFEDTRAGDTDIFGLRVDAAGNPIDALPFPITMALGNQTRPLVVRSGAQWLVVYLSEYDPGSGYFASQLRAQRVSDQGQVLDAAPLAIANDDTGMSIAAAGDGSGWVAAWTGYSSGNTDLRARRITANGAVLDPGGVVVQPGSYSIVFGLNVAWAGGNYLFTWNDNGTHGRRFAPDLVPTDPASVVLPMPTSTFYGNGSQWLAAWTRQTPQFTTEVVAQRLAANLTLVDATPIVISDPVTSPYPTDIMTTWDGSQWIVAWTQPVADVRAARLTSAGVLDPGGVPLPDGTVDTIYGPALSALPGGGALQLWHQARFQSADDVFAATFSAAGIPGPERCLSLGAEAQRTPRVAQGAGGYLVTTLAERSTGMRVLAWRVDALGRALDDAPIVIASANHQRLQVGGAAWNGACFLVVWADLQVGQVLARRLLPDGAWLDTAPFPVLPGFAPEVGASAGDFLVTALRAPSYPQFVYSYGARVRGVDGAVLDNPPLAIGTSYATATRIVELGGRWLVATESHWSHDQNQAGIGLAFVDHAGVVTAAGAVSVLNIQDWGALGLASDGNSALVVSQSGSNWTNTEIWIQRVLANGTQPAPMQAITLASPMGQSRGSATWNGREFVVAYQTLQNNVWFYDFEPDLYGIRVAATGTPIDAAGFPLWNGEDHEVRVHGDGVGHGKALFAASVFDAAAAAMRVAVRAMRPPGLTTFGTGTPGCAGTHGIDGNQAPVAGNAAFTLQVDRGPANGPGVLAIGTAGDVAGFDPGLGVRMHVAVLSPATAVLLGMPVDANGRGEVAMPLPPQPAYFGFGLFAQGAFLWNGPCSPSPLGFSTSPGLEVRIQAP